MRLQGRSAVVTGAGSEGIGRAVCERFAEEGASVVAFDVDGEGAEETARRIREQGGNAHAVTVDVADEAAVAQGVEQAVAQFGGLDTLVNCAGVMHNATVENETSAGWERILDINLKGMFYCCKYALPHIRRRNAGAIVLIGSVTGVVGFPNLSAYCASKGAIHSLARAMAMDYAADNIRVNAVAPGTVDTPILQGFLAQTEDPAKARASFDAIHPIGRVASPREIANVALFLASDEASFVTGHVLVADGGFTAYGIQPTD